MQVTNMAREPRWRPPPTCSWWARSRDGDFPVCREDYVPPCAGQHHVVCPRPQRCGKGLTIHGEAGKGLAEKSLGGQGNRRNPAHGCLLRRVRLRQEIGREFPCCAHPATGSAVP